MTHRTEAENPAAGELRLLQRLKQAIPGADLEELATLLRLDLRPASPSLRQTPPALETSLFPHPQPPWGSIASSAYPPKEKKVPFLYLARTEWKTPPKNTQALPDWYETTPSFEGQINSPQPATLRAPNPLLSWSALWPVLHTLFRTEKRISRLDVATLIDHAVKRRPLKRLPWQRKRRWPQDIVLVVDLSRHLAPFVRDYEKVALALKQWFHDRLKIVLCHDSEQQLFEYEGGIWEGLPPGLANTRLLYLGDLGLLDRRGLSVAQFVEWGRELRRRNIEAHALLTVSPVDCQAALARDFDLFSWDHTGLYPVSLAGERGGISAHSKVQTEEMLALLSRAIEIQPALVRRLRIERGYGVSVESLVMQHPALKGCAVHLQWRNTETRNRYEQRLEAFGVDEGWLWRLLKGHEAHLPLELQIEQRQQLGQALTDEQITYLRRLTRSFRDKTLDPAEEEMLIGWIERLARRADSEPWREELIPLYALYRRECRESDDCVIPQGVDGTRLPQWIMGTTRNQQPARLLQKGAQLIAVAASAPVERDSQELATFTWSEGAEYNLCTAEGNHKAPLRLDQPIELSVVPTAIEINAEDQRLTLETMTCPPWATGIGRDRYGLFVEVEVKGVPFVLRWIPPGEFMMGSPPDEPGRPDNEGPQHRVRFAQGFWLAETACTQALWQAVMGENPSEFKGEENPVERVSWNDVKQFIERINTQYPELELRLPSEAEWEYACRAGTITPFWFGSELTTDKANYNGNHPYADGPKGEYREKTVPSRHFQPNPWGLYQMHGNVWEWCEDTWHDSYEGAPEDGQPWLTGGDQEWAVIRGGSWIADGWFLRPVCRLHGHRDDSIDTYGFRLARGPECRLAQPGGAGAASGQPERGASKEGALKSRIGNDTSSSRVAPIEQNLSEMPNEEGHQLFLWEECTQNALRKAMENAVWDVESKTIRIEDPEDSRQFYEVRSWEELAQALDEIASTEFYANAPRDEGDFVFNNYEEFVEAILSEYEEQLEGFFDE